MQAREYRPDIDVLRAIAVLSVIFYHAHVPFFSGGYVGVSIFFVISGYLITGIIKRKLENGTFSFAEFYENRVRRIFPALFVMVFCLILFEWLTAVNTAERREVYSAAKRVLLTIPNIYFYLHTNYFDPAAETMPLLHTWSLGVEEQFYFVFPLLLFISYIYYRLNKNRLCWLLGILFAVSFVFSVVFVFYNQKFTFYMLPTRAWELITGSLLAYSQWTPKEQKAKVFLVCLGLLLMAGAAVGYTDNIYPGFWALIPCLGAALYIAGGTGLTSPFVSLFTGNRILVFIGVISYSLYLWHWPILVYYQHWLFAREITVQSGFLLLLAVFAVSVLSWRFVEKPVRQKPLFKKRPVLWTGVAACFGLALLFINNLTFTLADNEGGFVFTQKKEYAAEYNSDNPHKRILVVGDSHSGHLRPLLLDLAKEYQVSFKNYPMLPLGTYNGSKPPSALQKYQKQQEEFTAVVRKEKFDIAVIAYRYDYHLRGVDIVRRNTTFYPLKNLNKESASPEEALYLALSETVEILRENGVKQIYFVYPLPQAKSIVWQAANKLSFLFGFDTDSINISLGETKQEYAERTKEVYDVLHALAQNCPDIKFLNPLPYFESSSGQHYDVIKDRYCYYHDDDHLSEEGVFLLKPLFEPLFAHE